MSHINSKFLIVFHDFELPFQIVKAFKKLNLKVKVFCEVLEIQFMIH